MQPKFCSKCGNTLKEGDKFCRKCGAAVRAIGTATQQSSAPNQNNANIPSYKDVEARLNGVYSGGQPSTSYNPEGTVLLAGPSTTSGSMKAKRSASIVLTFEDMLRGCSKVVDFGTGNKYELNIPAGLSPGDKIIVQNTGIADPDTGRQCDIELTAMIG